MAIRTVQVTETYKVPDFLTNVERGVKVLDKVVPGWSDKINLIELNLARANSCVVGQLALQELLNGATGYFDGIKWLKEQKAIAKDKEDSFYGFNLPVESDEAVEWILRQPKTHPWQPLVGTQTQRTTEVETVVMGVFWDYLTSIWVQVIKDRQEHSRQVRKAQRAAKKATAKKTPAKVAKKATRARH